MGEVDFWDNYFVFFVWEFGEVDVGGFVFVFWKNNFDGEIVDFFWDNNYVVGWLRIIYKMFEHIL